MKPVRYFFYLLLIPIVFGFRDSGLKHRWEKLFNGKDLEGWNTYLGPDLDDNGKPITGQPIGLDQDPRHVFTIVQQDGENVIRISGENWGAISTKKEYENYHLQLEFKWGALSWGQKKNKKKDSGLLYHSVGKWGADYGAWMRSQEFQIEETNCGDYWGVAGGMAEIPAIKKSETEYVYSPQASLITFREGSAAGRRCIKQIDAENPSGQWNTLDLYCHGDTSMHIINGKLMMILYHGQQQDNGQFMPLTRGNCRYSLRARKYFTGRLRLSRLTSCRRSFCINRFEPEYF